jgi:multiple sugar transport system permease protein
MNPLAGVNNKAAVQAPARHRFRLSQDIVAYLFLSPYLLLFIIFLFIPGVASIFISFTRWGIMGDPVWTGLQNYERLFRDSWFIRSIQNTGTFVLLTAVPLVVLGFVLALLFNQRLRGRNIARTIIFLPHVLTVSAVGIVWSWILDRNFGMLNFYLSPLGINPPLNWLASTDTAMIALVVTTVWWTVNTNMIIYLAGLQDIPEELFEAARIDGASGWQITRFITIPMLLPVNAFVIPLTVIATWRVFGQAVVMTGGGPQGRTFMISQYIYTTAFQNFNMGQASAAAVILLLITLVFTLVQLRAMKAL